MFLGLWITL